jgi:hypothetical protein
MKKFLQLALLAVLSTIPAYSSETAILRNGFSILHQRREIIGTNTRLFIDQDPANFVDIPTAEIDHYEEAPDLPKLDPPNPDQPKSALEAELKPLQFDLTEAVKNASGTYQLDPDLVTSVIRAESGFNIRARSPKGAQGLMQLMPQTATQLGVQNAYDPQANVEAGTRYLRELLEHYNFDLIKALAAYNAGPQRIDQYHGVPPYYETRAYVARIVRDFNKKKLAAKAASSSSSSSSSAKRGSSPKETTTHALSKPVSTPPSGQLKNSSRQQEAALSR